MRVDAKPNSLGEIDRFRPVIGSNAKSVHQLNTIVCWLFCFTNSEKI